MLLGDNVDADDTYMLLVQTQSTYPLKSGEVCFVMLRERLVYRYSFFHLFYPRDAGPVFVGLLVCLSVCRLLSVTSLYCPKITRRKIMQITPHDSHRF